MPNTSMNRYWIPNLEIHKKVITQELQFYLGPQATVRPYTSNGEDGFLITTPGECLTDEQIDDICRQSLDMWRRLAAARSPPHAGKHLKRPLHHPVVISRATPDAKRRNRNQSQAQRRSPNARKPPEEPRGSNGSNGTDGGRRDGERGSGHRSEGSAGKARCGDERRRD